MICFRDMTYCISPTCINVKCFRHPEQHRIDRMIVPHIEELPTMWADFTDTCHAYIPAPKEKAA